MLPEAVNQIRWPYSSVEYTRMSFDFEAKPDLGMNFGSGPYSLLNLGQLPLTSLSL